MQYKYHPIQHLWIIHRYAFFLYLHSFLFFGYHIVRLKHLITYVVYSDVSATGCGAHLDVNNEQVCYKLWDVDDCGKSSAWGELLAISFALESFLPLFKDSNVKWFSDSQN